MIEKKGDIEGKKSAIVSDKVGNYEKHPFFVKKKETAKAFLKKNGLPTALVKKGN